MAIGRASVVAALTSVVAAAGASAAPPPSPTDKVLSNERTRTVWAHPRTRATAYEFAAYKARKVGRLHRRTEDGFGEVYVVLRRHTDAQGRRWLRIRMPGRPNGRKGWVRSRALGRLHTVTTRLVIDRRHRRTAFYRRGKRVWGAPVGVGKAGTPTPSGRFWIREGFSVPGNGIYGAYAFGTSAYSVLSDWPGGGVVGIHGTNQPELIPGRPSHGCVRLKNRDIRWLARHMPVGTPVRIR